MLRRVGGLLGAQQSGLLLIVLILVIVLTKFAGHHFDRVAGHEVNNFLNPSTLLQVATDTSFIAIMAVGMMMVIISGGIDLSVGSTYSLCSVLMAMTLTNKAGASPFVALAMCCGIGILCGLLNGIMVAKLGVHPFIITLGTMWVFRGISFVTTNAASITVPTSLTDFAKMNLGLRSDLYPLPFLITILVTVVGGIYLTRTTWGRRIFAVGGNLEASRYAGLKINPILVGVYTIAGLLAGLSGFLGCSFYGSASSGDATGYELYVIAAAVVGGASLTGGKGSAFGAFLGALVIQLFRQGIQTLNINTNYDSIIIGTALIIAVVLDRTNALIAEKRALRERG